MFPVRKSPANEGSDILLISRFSSPIAFAGGIPSDLISSNRVSVSTPYLSTELTWCVYREKPIPTWLNMWQIGSKLIWCLSIINTYIEAVLISLFMKFERGHNGFMKKDFHYAAALIAVPVYTGTPHMVYQPKSIRMALLLLIFIIPGFLFSIVWSTFLIRYITMTIDGVQIGSAAEILTEDYRLFGDELAKAILGTRKQVSSFCTSV